MRGNRERYPVTDAMRQIHGAWLELAALIAERHPDTRELSDSLRGLRPELLGPYTHEGEQAHYLASLVYFLPRGGDGLVSNHHLALKLGLRGQVKIEGGGGPGSLVLVLRRELATPERVERELRLAAEWLGLL